MFYFRIHAGVYPYYKNISFSIFLLRHRIYGHAKKFSSWKHSTQMPSRRYVPQNLNLEGCSFDNLEMYATMKWKENIAVLLWFSSSVLKWDLEVLLQIPLESR